jgi:hypothetical protein
MIGKDFEVDWFVGFGDVTLVKTVTDEVIEIWSVDVLKHMAQKISNLDWLMPLALDKNNIVAEIRYSE